MILNNPGNLRSVAGQVWKGTLTSYKGFVVFDTMKNGYRALYIVLYAYIEKHKCNNIHKIISRWAPESENDTKAYIEYVCDYMDMFALVYLPIWGAEMYVLGLAIAAYESGPDRVRPDHAMAGYNSAQIHGYLHPPKGPKI